MPKSPLLFCLYLALLVLAVSALRSSQRERVLSPKNVVFGASGGGASHVKWVLSIMDELANRGHNVTFVAGGDNARFGAKYERINTISLADSYEEFVNETTHWSHRDWVNVISSFLSLAAPSYPEQFVAFQSLFETIKPDVVLCDDSTTGCVDATVAPKLPLIATMIMAKSPDAQVPYVERTLMLMEEPTTLAVSFTSRFYNRFIHPLRLIAAFWKPYSQYMDFRKQVNAPPFLIDPLANSLKLVSSAFGFEPARPLGPLVELVGPIVDQDFPPLTHQLKEYLDEHDRVAYVAFGQTYTPSPSDIQLLFSALVDNMEKGIIDGVLWATVHMDPTAIPELISLPSGQPYNTSNTLGGRNPYFRMVKWAPQQAVLEHEAVAVFLTHGGIGSIYESLIHGVPLAVFPLLGDQPVNARVVEEIGVGVFIDYRASSGDASATLEAVVRDVTGGFRENVGRYGDLIRIKSAHGALRGADLVEEVLVMHKDGLLPHRYEASRQMSYLKATNWDLDITMMVLVATMMWSLWRTARV